MRGDEKSGEILEIIKLHGHPKMEIGGLADRTGCDAELSFVRIPPPSALNIDCISQTFDSFKGYTTEHRYQVYFTGQRIDSRPKTIVL